jgi:hypothetical protein
VIEDLSGCMDFPAGAVWIVTHVGPHHSIPVVQLHLTYSTTGAWDLRDGEFLSEVRELSGAGHGLGEGEFELLNRNHGVQLTPPLLNPVLGLLEVTIIHLHSNELPARVQAGNARGAASHGEIQNRVSHSCD